MNTTFSEQYLSSSLIFNDDKIITEPNPDSTYFLISEEVMMDWEAPIMSASAAYITEGGGNILEIGFGMGISANYIQSHSIDSHTIVENHPQIIEKAVQWANGKSNVTIISQSWYDVKDSLGVFDGIFLDTFGDDKAGRYFSSSLSNWKKSGTKVTFWNDNQQGDVNNYNISASYKSINILPEPNSYFTGSTTYYMPKVEL